MYERFGKGLVRVGRKHLALRFPVLLVVLLLFGIDALLLAAGSLKRSVGTLLHSIKKLRARAKEASAGNAEKFRTEITALRQHTVKRAVAAGLSLALIAGLFPTASAFAAEGCTHVHDETCGYVEAVEGHECGHVHNEACGYAAPTEEAPCNKDCTDTNGDGVSDHAEDCAYKPAAEGSPCGHTHDAACGYVKAIAGSPCTHVCDETCGGVSDTNDEQSDEQSGEQSGEQSDEHSDENKVLLAGPGVTEVTINSDSDNFNMFANALESSDDVNIRLNSHVQIKEDITIPAGKTATLNLNGYKVQLYSDGESKFPDFTVKGTLIVEDNALSKSGIITLSMALAITPVSIETGGTFTLKSGTLDRLSVSVDGGTANIEGGKICGGIDRLASPISVHSGTLNLLNGELYKGNSSQPYIIAASGADVNLGAPVFSDDYASAANRIITFLLNKTGDELPFITAACGGEPYSGADITIDCSEFDEGAVVVKSVTADNKSKFTLAANEGGKTLEEAQADSQTNLVISAPTIFPPEKITVDGVSFDPLIPNYTDEIKQYKFHVDNPEVANTNGGISVDVPAVMNAKMTTLEDGSYYLTEDMYFNLVIIKGDVKLCLNGHKLIAYDDKFSGYQSQGAYTWCNCIVQLTSGSTLSVYDSDSGGGQLIGKCGRAFDDYNSDNYVGTIQAVGDATLNLYGGTVTWKRGSSLEALHECPVLTESNFSSIGVLTVNMNGGSVDKGDAGRAISATNVSAENGTITGGIKVSGTTALTNTEVNGRVEGKTVSINGGTVTGHVVISGDGAMLTLKGAPVIDCISLDADSGDTTKPTIALDGFAPANSLKIQLIGYDVGDTIVTDAASGAEDKFTITAPLGRALEHSGSVLKLKDAHNTHHPSCGASCTVHDPAHENVTWTSWAGGNVTTGNYALGGSFSLAPQITPNAGSVVNLCLNGYTLTSTYNMIKINPSGASVVNLCDCAGGGTISEKVDIGGPVTLNVYSGNLNMKNNSSVINFNTTQSATLNLYGGKVSCVESGSYAVINGKSLDNAVINLYGGEVTAEATSKFESDQARAYGIGGKNIHLYGGSVTATAVPCNDAQYNTYYAPQGYAIMVPAGTLTLHEGAAIHGSTADVQLTAGGTIVLDGFTGNCYEGSEGIITVDFIDPVPNSFAWKTGDTVVTGAKEGDLAKFKVIGNGLRERKLVYDSQTSTIRVGELPAHNHSVCCGTVHNVCEHSGSVLYAPLEVGVLDASADGNYYLTSDLRISAPTIPAGTTINLCLNGHTLGVNNGITVNGTLNICDCTGGGKVNMSGQFEVAPGGALNLYNVGVSKNWDNDTQAYVIVSTGGSVSVYDGSITTQQNYTGEICAIWLNSSAATLTIGGSPAISDKSIDISISYGTIHLDDYIYNSADYATKKGQLNIWAYEAQYTGLKSIADFAKFVFPSNKYFKYNNGMIQITTAAEKTNVTQITSITAKTPAPMITIGGTVDLNNKITISPSNSTDKQLAWVAVTPDIATIDRHGVVTGVSAGEATFTGYSTDGSGVILENIPVTVSAVSKPTVTAPANFTANAKAAWSFTAPTVNENGSALTGQGWEIKIGDGEWTSIANGSTASFTQNGAKLRYFAVNEQGTGYSAEATLTVNKVAYPGAAKIEWPTASSITYGDALSSSTLSKTEGFAWKDSTEKPAVSSNGCTVVYTPTDTDYTPVEHDIAVSVAKKALTPAVNTVDGKVYDGTAAATGTLTLTGAVNNETPAATGDFAFTAADKGDNKTVSVTNITLSDDWGDNYDLSTASLTDVPSTAAVTALAYSAENTNIVFAPVPDQPYTGSPVTPDVSITAYGAALIKGTDYTLSYANNTEIRDKSANNSPTATINFIRNFSGTKTVAFSIVYARLPDTTPRSEVFKQSDSELTRWHKGDITLEAKDGWQVSTDASTWQSSVTLSTESTTSNPSTQTVYIKSGDNVFSVPVSYSLDKTVPAITEVTAPSTSWSKDSQSITFTAADAVSGISSCIVERVKQGEETADVSYPVTDNNSFTADRNGTYHITVTDNAGNITTENVIISKIDKTAPEISWNNEIISGKWYGATNVSASATDNCGETPAITLKVNGEMKDNAFSVIENGVYAVAVTATDAAGNTAEISATLRVETKIDEFLAKAQDFTDPGLTYQQLIDTLTWYNALSATVKDRLSKNDDAAELLASLNDALADKAAEAASGVAGAITDADTIEKIEKAKSDYDALPETAKDSVPAETETELSKKTEDAKKAQDVIGQLENADRDKKTQGETVTDPGGSYEEKQAALEGYDGLNDDSKALVGQSSEAVSDKESIEADLAAINAALAKLAAVTKPYAPESKGKIVDAKSACDALNQKQMDAFPAEKKSQIDALEAIRGKAQSVEDTMSVLNDASPLSDLTAATAAYNALSADEKLMVSGELKTALDTKYEAKLDELGEVEKAAAEFATKVEETKTAPTVGKIEQLIRDHDELTAEAKEKLSDATESDYNELTTDYNKANPVIAALNGIDLSTRAPGNIAAVNDALNQYNVLTDSPKKLVDEATNGKREALAKAVQEIIEAAAKVEAIPEHGESSKNENGTPDLTDCGNDGNENGLGGSGGHTYEDHKTSIEEAKIAYEKLSDEGRMLISGDVTEKLNSEYTTLMTYLEYINKASSAKTTVEVAGLAEKVKLPDESATASKTVVIVEIRDSEPESKPSVPEGKSEALSVEIKLVAKLYENADDLEPVEKAPIQPEAGKTVLVKLRIPAGFKTDTLELWHVKDNGARSKITDFWLVTEDDGIYAVFEVDSFSHFMFFAERDTTPFSPADSSDLPDSGRANYSPTVKTDANGTASTSPRAPQKGDTVTITPNPAAGYEVASVTVTDRSGKPLDVTEEPDGTYTFTQPDSRAAVEVSFRPALPFTDVPEWAWYRENVRYVYEKGLMEGTGKNSFAPHDDTARGMIVTILWHLENEPESEESMSFNDVEESKYYYDAVKWAAEQGIVLGCDAQTFAPEKPITRQQLAAILWRYAKHKGYDVTSDADLSGFSDNGGISSYAKAAMGWANAEGLINGIDAASLAPQDNATRAQVAAILHRFCDVFVK